MPEQGKCGYQALLQCRDLLSYYERMTLLHLLYLAIMRNKKQNPKYTVYCIVIRDVKQLSIFRLWIFYRLRFPKIDYHY